MKPLRIRAVIFDMDGLMIDTERIAQEAWQLAAAELGHPIPEETVLLAVGRTVADTELEFKRILGQDFPFQAMYDRKQAHLYAAVAAGAIPVKTGLPELLDLVDGLALPKAVATSTKRELALKKLAGSGLAGRFPMLVGGDEVVHGKPAPDVFLTAGRRLGVSPSRCLVLEDSEPGVMAAHAAGMVPIMVPDLKPPSPQIEALAAAVLPSLHEVATWIRARPEILQRDL